MGTKKPTVLPRGNCPDCGREVALLSDGTIHRPHRRRPRKGGWCSGVGKRAQARQP